MKGALCVAEDEDEVEWPVIIAGTLVGNSVVFSGNSATAMVSSNIADWEWAFSGILMGKNVVLNKDFP